MEADKELSEAVIGAAYKVANALGYGFLEKVYENALVIELRKSGLEVAQQVPMTVYYEGVVVGDYFADLFVAGELVVELKVARAIDDRHVAQLLNYLKACRKRVGLLINFGGTKVEVRRLVNGY
jgi:GxxExxY protein